MADVLLLGSDGTEWETSIGEDWLSLHRFQAVASGTLTKIRTDSLENGNVKVGIYSDDSGEPANLLASVGSTAVTEGENFIDIGGEVEIVADTYYWLAILAAVHGAKANFAGGTRRTKYLGFSSEFPNPAGTGYSTGNVLAALSGWATEAGGSVSWGGTWGG